MVDRKLFIILILLAFYSFITKPMMSSMFEKKMELRNIDKSIAKEKFVEKKSNEIKNLYPKMIKKIAKNKSRLFSSTMSDSTAMSSIQKIIKDTAVINNLQIVEMNWGVAVDKKSYVVLPISFRLTGYPDGISNFIYSILNQSKLMRFYKCYMIKTQKKITMSGMILGFKLKAGK